MSESWEDVAAQMPKVYRKEEVGVFEVSTIIHRAGHAESMLFYIDDSRQQREPNPRVLGMDPEDTHAQMKAQAEEWSANGTRF